MSSKNKREAIEYSIPQPLLNITITPKDLIVTAAMILLFASSLYLAHIGVLKASTCDPDRLEYRLCQEA